MDNMYGIIERLCAERGITIGKLCAELKISRGIIGDLKAGRTKQLSAVNIRKIADFFRVSVDYLLGEEKRPTPVSESGPSAEFAKLMSQLTLDEQKLIVSQIKGILSNRE